MHKPEEKGNRRGKCLKRARNKRRAEESSNRLKLEHWASQRPQLVVAE